MAKALKSFIDAGNFDTPICKWEARPAAVQTYANLIVLMCSKFSKLNRQDSTTARAAGRASANNFIKEMAQATEELVAELAEKHTKQVEVLIKSNKEAREKLSAAILANKSGNPATTATNSNSSSSKAVTKRAAKATTCPQCNCVHPNCMHNQCWELPANAANAWQAGHQQRAPEGARGFW